LVAGYAAPYEPPRERAPERHVEAERPGELVGIDCFFVGRLQGTKGSVWQLTAIDIASSFAWAELVNCPHRSPTGAQTSKLAQRVCAELANAGWRLERMLSDNGGEFRSADFRNTLAELGVRHSLIRASRPQTNGHVEALHRLILEECWRPAFARYLHVRFTGLERDLNQYLASTTTGASTTAASPAAGSPRTSSTVPTK
jgi:transposase InsO family protein